MTDTSRESVEKLARVLEKGTYFPDVSAETFRALLDERDALQARIDQLAKKAQHDFAVMTDAFAQGQQTGIEKAVLVLKKEQAGQDETGARVIGSAIDRIFETYPRPDAPYEDVDQDVIEDMPDGEVSP